MVKPEPAIYKHLVEKTGIVPAESVFIDDLLKNVIAARECGFHAIQFRDPASCRAELRAYLPDIDLDQRTLHMRSTRRSFLEQAAGCALVAQAGTAFAAGAEDAARTAATC